MIFNVNTKYSNAAKGLKSVRDSIDGEPTIKRLRTEYLKHPGIDQTSSQAVARYEKYIEGAEFDGFPSTTESSMLGKMKASEADIDLPDAISYLEQNADGDGMPMTGMVELLYKNLLEAKYHILLSEMGSLASSDDDSTEPLSKADVDRLDLKATIKTYTRESLIDWDFERIDGVLQLSFMVLQEIQQVRDPSNFAVTERKINLVLALDGDGNYYQQKYISGESGGFDADGDRVYPKVGGEPIKWIPVQIVADEVYPAGSIPEGLGYLYPVCSAALSRYALSADYKEALRFMQPTMFTRGWKQGDKELFQTLNDRDHLAFGVGVSNNLPNNVEVSIEGVGVQAEPYERYLKDNEAKAKALGASFDTTGDAGNVSATEAAISNANQTAAMSSIVNNVEAAMARMCLYCGMFMGLWSPDEIEDNIDAIKIDLYDDFGRVKLTPEEQTANVNNVNSGLYSREEGQRILIQGGVTVSDQDTIDGELEEQGAQPVQGGITAIPESQEETLQSNEQV